ncbi:MAG: universal stress protein [Deltaproteobacteria bacterium]|nr:universal stress protein [Deltaproteobacteria bacterium]
MKVLVACDGSQESRNAVRLAAELPLEKSGLQLLSVSRHLEAEGLREEDELYGEHGLTEFNTKNRQNCEAVLEEARDIAGLRGIDSSMEILRGRPAEAICHHVKKTGTELIVMGHRGLNPVKRFFMGSVSDAVLRECPASVLLAGASEDQGATFHFNKPVRITVAYDGSPAAEKAFAFIKKFPADAVSHVNLLSVVELEYYPGFSAYNNEELFSTLRRKQYKNEQARLIAEFQKLTKIPVSPHVMVGSQGAVYQILEFTEQHPVDLVIVGDKSQKQSAEPALGTVAYRLAHQLTRPLLVVR